VAASVPSVKIIKQFLFKGQTHRWSNRYYFNGGTPSSGANWDALFDAVVLVEKTALKATCTIVEAVGYEAGSDIPVRSKTYTTVGTNGDTGPITPGECVALVRYSTGARSSKNHPVYAFSYYHGVCSVDGANNYDKLGTTQKTSHQTYANGWVSGITAGGITAVRATPTGHACTAALVEQWITHRDFPPSTSV
jgi:hypothetical protein